MASQAGRDISVIGASAGGITVLREVLAHLPADHPAAVLVVVHLAPESPSVLPGLLDRLCPMPVTEARPGPVRPGTVQIAVPDQHLVLEPGMVQLAHGARENRHRPSIDVLFRSAAAAYGPRVTGVILSGMLDDGAAGLWAIKRQGGATVVQDPRDAEYPDMPRNALELVEADHVVPVRDLAATLVRIARQPPLAAQLAGQVPEAMQIEVRMAAQNDAEIDDLDAIGKRSAFTCPECGGALWEMSNGGVRYRCHVGHAYSAGTLSSDQTTRVEAALWAALRSLEESVRLSQLMAADAKSRGSERSARFHDEIAHANERAPCRHAARADQEAPSATRDEAAEG
jgi:two-component system chemotaxis response regulator CheB